jgi:peptidyl-prolyl cis-trans isomerase SurA
LAVVETPFGIHLVRRDAVVQARASHIVVRWKGAWRSTQTRTKAEASARIGQAQQALDAGTPFEEVAKRYSDDSTAAIGGDLGWVAPGQLIPTFEDALFALAPGQRSAPVETPYGFHLISRRQ